VFLVCLWCSARVCVLVGLYMHLIHEIEGIKDKDTGQVSLSLSLFRRVSSVSGDLPFCESWPCILSRGSRDYFVLVG